MKLFGKNPVLERLRSKPHTIRKIHVQEGFSDGAYIRKKARQHGVPIYVVPKSKIDKMGRHSNAQGLVVDVDDFEYEDYNEMLEYAIKKKRTLLFLDGILDPQNFGAIIRTAGCLGNFSLVIPTHKSVKVTEAVLRVASGGDNHVQIAQVSNLRNAIKKSKDQGFQIIGTVVGGGHSLEETTLPFPLGIVLGSEQKGIREVTRKEIDLEVTIPMHIDRMSFNVANAATILCYEVTRQRILHKKK